MAETATAQSADLEDVRALLVSSGLPTSDLESHFPDAFVVIRDGRTLLAAAGLEVHGEGGLLRSVAVAPSHRSRGLGQMVVSDRLRVAEERALAAVYLLTTTAPEYFAELGFSRVERASAPEAMQSSSEFASICPASATCMVKMLR